MHLWRRQGGWTFQKRVPADVVNRLGTTPIRLSLPTLQAREAQRTAVLLAGVAEQAFSKLRREGMADGTNKSDARDELIAQLRRQLEAQDMLFSETRALLRGSAQAREMDAKSIAELTKTIGDLRSDLAHRGTQSNRQKLPLLSAELPEYIAHKRRELDPEGDGSDQVTYVIPAAFAAFLEAVGDKPLDEYRASDLESFGFLLARVPINKAKLKKLKNMTFEEAADFNAKLREPYVTLTETTITRNYLNPVKAGVRWIMRQHKETSPFVDVEAKAPKSARPAQPRDSLTKKEVNALLQVAADRTRSEDRWIPLIAYVTGARLNEIVQMQGRNIQKISGKWIFDLRKGVVRKDKKIRQPKVKNNASLRPIVLHDTLVELGFIEWAKSRPGYIFDQLHRAKSPRRTASKRMNRLLKAAGLKGKNKKVFHGQRHATKDWLRDMKLHDRDINLQVGHAMANVAEEYGKKSLRPEDYDGFATAALPKEIDLSAYRKRADEERQKKAQRQKDERQSPKTRRSVV